LIKSVAVDQDDNIYVVDGRSHSVSIFNQTGNLLLVFGGYYAVSTSGKNAPGGFSLPSGIDIDSRGRIYVADKQNRRIQVFQYLPLNSSPPAVPTVHHVK
jgi:DNA-binding beta-propeller fold protein YncE